MNEFIAVVVYFVSLLIFSRILFAVSKWKFLLGLYLVSSVPPAFAKSRSIYYWTICFFCLLSLVMAVYVHEDVGLMIYGIVGVAIGLVWAISNGHKAAYKEYRAIASMLANEANNDEDRIKYEEMAQQSDTDLQNRIGLSHD